MHNWKTSGERGRHNGVARLCALDRGLSLRRNSRKPKLSRLGKRNFGRRAQLPLDSIDVTQHPELGDSAPVSREKGRAAPADLTARRCHAEERTPMDTAKPQARCCAPLR